MENLRWADLAVGRTASFEATVTREMIETFRAMSGDMNPLHGDEDFARARGFENIVAHGMLVSAFYSRLVGMHLPGSTCLLHEIRVTFANPAYPGDAVVVSGVVTHLNDACRQMEIKARIERAALLISRATIRVGVGE